jgi:hypothetical protein
LEEELARERKRLADVQEEKRAAYAWVKAEFLRMDSEPPNEDIEQMIKDGTAIPFKEVIDELEQLLAEGS